MISIIYKEECCLHSIYWVKWLLYFLASGIPQGKLIKRQQLPKDDLGNCWHWKDLNLAINVTFYGKSIRICSCDEWTKVWSSLEAMTLNYEVNKLAVMAEQCYDVSKINLEIVSILGIYGKRGD